MDVAAGPTAHLDLLRSGQVSSRELTQATLDAVTEANRALNAVVEFLAEEALAAADDADRRRAQGEDGPLLGVPIAVKNELDIAGHLTARGSRAVVNPAGQDDEIVAHIRAAGMPMVATTTLPELAACGFTETEAFGITRNPHDPDRTPGGSSGGSAALVAAGAVPIATASDGAGSIRIPAACCGVPGFKPTHGTMPSSGGWHGMSTQGCLTQRLADAALYLDTFGSFGSSLVEAAGRPSARLRIGVTEQGSAATRMRPVDPKVRGALRQAADQLTDAGHAVRDVSVSYGLAAKSLTARYLGGIAQEAREVDDPTQLEKVTRGMARAGRPIGPRLIAWARRQGEQWGNTIHDSLGVDILLTPVMTGVAPRVGQFAGHGGVGTVLAMNAFYPYTAQWNHGGLPAVSMPRGSDNDGHPLAVQLIGTRHQDATLMSVAAELERMPA